MISRKTKFEVFKNLLGIELLILFILTILFFGVYGLDSAQFYVADLKELVNPLYVSAAPILLLLLVTQVLTILFSYKGKNKVLSGFTGFFEDIFQLLYPSLYSKALKLED